MLPFSYTVGDQEFTPEDSAEFNGKAFYDAMRSGADVKTAMIPLGTFMDGFRAALEAGDDVLYIGMSGGVSGTNQAAMLAANELTEDFPEAADRRDRHLCSFTWRRSACAGGCEAA